MLKFEIKTLSVAYTVELYIGPFYTYFEAFPWIPSSAQNINRKICCMSLNRSRVFFSEQELSIIAHDITSEEVNKQGLHDGKRV